MEKTENYGLNLIGGSDRVERAPLNENALILERELSTASNLVADWETGKRYTVRADIKDFGVKKTTALTEAGVTFKAYDNDQGAPNLHRWGDRVVALAVGTTGSGNASVGYSTAYSAIGAVLDARTGDLLQEIAQTTSMITSSGSTVGNYHFVQGRAMSPDGSVVGYNMISNNAANITCRLGVDASSGLALAVSAEFFWSSENYWGYVTSGTAPVVHRYTRGSSTEKKTITVSASNNLIPVCVKGDLLYLLDEAAYNKMFRLFKVDLAEATVAIGIYGYDIPTQTGISGIVLRNLVTTDKYAWFSPYAYVTPAPNYNVSSTNKVFRLDLETWELDTMGLTSDDWRRTDDTTYLGSAMYRETTSYIGTVGNTAYFWTGNYIYMLDQETGAVSSYTIEQSDTSGKLGSLYPVVFDIPELPGVIITGNRLFDTNTGKMRDICGGEAYTIDEYGYLSQVRITPRYTVTFGGTATDTEIMGQYDQTTLVGGTLTYEAAAIEEYTGEPDDAMEELDETTENGADEPTDDNTEV